jgi:hypothetical protein
MEKLCSVRIEKKKVACNLGGSEKFLVAHIDMQSLQECHLQTSFKPNQKGQTGQHGGSSS